MGFLNLLRRRVDTGPVEYTETAVPLTPDEVALLVEALHEDHRLWKAHRPDIGGVGSLALDQAQQVSHIAGVAAALGHPVVPISVRNISGYDYALDTFMRYAPRSPIAARFRLLLTKLHMLAGMASVHDWKAGRVDGVYRWITPPANVPSPAASQPELAAGS